MTVLKMENINISYKKKQVLHDVNLSFETGHCYLLLGRNGSGKTSLLEAVLNAPKGSKITIDDKPVAGNITQMNRVFCVSRGKGFPGDLSIRNVLAIMDKAFFTFDKEFAESLLEKIGVDTKTKIGKLSLGQSSMLYGILAVSAGTEYVLMDEPELGIDVPNRELFYSELAKRMAECSSCFVIATHTVSEFQPLADRVVILKDGTVAYAGELEELECGYVRVSGKKDELEARITDGKQKKELGSYASVIVKSNVWEELEDQGNLECLPCDVSEIFLAMTEDGE